MPTQTTITSRQFQGHNSGLNYDSQNTMPKRARTHLAVYRSPCIAGHGIHVFTKVRQQAMLAETARALWILAGQHTTGTHFDVLAEMAVPVSRARGQKTCVPSVEPCM